MRSETRKRRVAGSALAGMLALIIGPVGVAQGAPAEPAADGRPVAGEAAAGDAVRGNAAGDKAVGDKAARGKAARDKAGERLGGPTAPDVAVTLITGDRVTLRGGDPALPTVQAGPGRRQVKFAVRRDKDRLSVIPSDVSSAVDAGALDRRLFDVTELIRNRYDDRSTQTIPLIVTYRSRTARVPLAGATTTRTLSAVNGAAVRLDKAKTSGVAASTRSFAGAGKIWLDARRQLSLDRSVPQIGAPAAWAAGYTGRGVTVAVLDSGVDATHPDLAGQVAGARNFTTEDAADTVGHGTHVASTIAGTGAASGGRYKGVAPAAKLYDGKVCERYGCDESAILAGMEWAATEVKAKAVNLSLGGPDTPEVDLVEEAVNRLTAQTGTLFVVAAGNEGPGAASVQSPGSADAALTVGAVDGQDALAQFSSRGPRLGDGAVKPDVTAPGVGIVAARAKGSSPGQPADEQYRTLSGTSMATPHVAGAVALLAQQHTGWTAAELKGALTGSAKPQAQQTAFEQGAGRVDLARAINQFVIAEPGSLSFGTALWPHDDDTAVTRALTYRNLGDRAVTLDLAGTLTTADGTPAPVDALTVSPRTVSIPAGGTVTVRAVSTTRHSGPDGAYSGRITATGDGIAVTTPVVVDKEAESYDLTISNLGPDGRPSAESTSVLGLDNGVQARVGGATGTGTIRLPKATYHLDMSLFVEKPEYRVDTYQIVRPNVVLDRDTEVVMDARTARAISTTVERTGASTALTSVGYLRSNPAGDQYLLAAIMGGDFQGMYSAHQGPALPAAQLTSHITSQWGMADESGRFDNTPYIYSLVNALPGRMYTGFSRAVKDSELATVVVTQHAQADRRAMKFVVGVTPDDVTHAAHGFVFDLPSRVTHLLESGSVSWMSSFEEFVPDEMGSPLTMTRLITSVEGYTAGRVYRERLNAAPFVPRPGYTVRLEDQLEIDVSGYDDADGHAGGSQTDTAATRLYRNGEPVGESDEFGRVAVSGLPAAAATYRFVTSATRGSVSGFSTHTDLTWTFTSAGTASEQQLPLRTVGFRPAVDGRNTAERLPVTVLPLQVLTRRGVSLPAAREVELQVSGDEGRTWRRAAVVAKGGGAYTAAFATPKGARTVSLRAKVLGPEGSVTEQTVISAYHLR